MKISSLRLRLAREEAHLSLREVSELLEKKGFRAFSMPAISYWESGESIPRADVLAALAEIYKVKIDFFFSPSDEPNQLSIKP